MDYQMENTIQQDNQTSGPAPSEPKQSPNNMATASLVMGILSLVSCCCYYVSFIFCGLGILFALLSRTGEPMVGRAKVGLGLSIVGLVLAAVLWGGLLIMGFSGSSYFDGGPIQNLPVIPDIPDITQPSLDNVLTIFRRLPMGGGL